MFTKLHCIKYLSNILNIHCTITTKYPSNSDFLVLNVKLKLNDSCICFCFGTWKGVGFGTPLQRQKQYAQHRVRKASEDMFELKKAKWTKPSESALMNKTKAKARRNKIRQKSVRILRYKHSLKKKMLLQQKYACVRKGFLSYFVLHAKLNVISFCKIVIPKFLYIYEIFCMLH